MKINEEQLENLVLSWFAELGYITKNGLDIAPETPEAERTDYRQVILRDRLRTKLLEINPEIPNAAITSTKQPRISSSLARRHQGRVSKGRRDGWRFCKVV